MPETLHHPAPDTARALHGRLMTARDRLNSELQSLLERGLVVACAVSGLATSEDADERAQAAAECRPCPLRATCRDVGREERHRFGVWGGFDLSARPASRARQEASA